MSLPIYVIGSSNTDMVVKCERLPAPGETVLGGTFFMNAGGKGANQAVAAARLGGQVSLIANVGDDLFGRQAIEQFRKEGIRTDFISTDPLFPSGVALINVDEHGENCITVAPGANAHLTPEKLTSFFEFVKAPALILVQLEIPVSTVEFIIQKASAASIPVIVNPAPAQQLSEKSWTHVHTITPNKTEAELLTGIRIEDDASVQETVRQLHEKGIKHVVITLGKRGAYWSIQSRHGFVSAPPVTAIDSTAAGDCFSGALAVALAENKTMEEAVRFACVAASLSVTRLGAQAAMPSRKEVDSHLLKT